MRLATDIVRIFRVMSVHVTPSPDADDAIYADAGTLVLSAAVSDPEQATPHTFQWEQTPVSAPGVGFGTPTQATTTFGPLAAGMSYYAAVTVTSARLQQKVLRFRILVR